VTGSDRLRPAAAGCGGRGATGSFLQLVSTGPTTSMGAAAGGPAPWWGAAPAPQYRRAG